MADLGWVQYTDRMTGKGHPSLPDTLNAALREVLSDSGYDPDATTFPGLMGPVFNVKAYGAVGDGVTDDTAAITAAITAASAQVEFFGTTLISCSTVYFPVLASPSGQTKSYLVTATIPLPQGVTLQGGGINGATVQFKPVTPTTLFTFFGSSEGQATSILLQNMFFFQNGPAATSIGFRLRNFGFVQLRNTTFSNFRVGLWADWGQDVECYDSSFTLCERGVQIGGNLTQTETPAPPAGIRGGPGTAWFDNGNLIFCKFSQNKIDITHLGSTQSHGCTLVQNCTFFESSSSPVTGKTRFIHTTALKNLVVQACWFETGTASRTGIVQSALDFDGNAGAANLGGLIQANHFLLSGATSTGINISSGAAVIADNVIELSATSPTHVALSDTTRSSCVLLNSYLTFADTLVAPTFSLTGRHLILDSMTTSLIGPMAIDDPSIALLEFRLAQVRKAGLRTVIADRIDIFDSAGTTKGFIGAAFASAQVNMGTGSSFTPNMSNANSHIGTANAATTINAPVGTVQAGIRLTVTIIQDGTGGRAVTWNAVFKVSWSDAGNTLNKRSSISFIWDGTNWNQDGAQTPYV